MLALKKGEFTSLGRYSNVICALSVVISVCLLNGCIQSSVAVEAEISSSPEHIEKSCTEKCPDQNQNASNSAECMDKCGQNQCAAGCRLWELALDTSCKVACNTTDPDVEDWYCVMGCNNAISQYFKWLMAEIGTPPAPALLADSLTSTSLSLEWEIPEHLSQIMKRQRNVLRNYLVQWRYEESGNDWKYYRNQSMEDSSTIRVENLQPYTKYRFRVALIVSSFREVELYSEQSLVIITAEDGPPQSEPVILRAVAVDNTRISIAWEPGLLKNGPILFYVLQIKESHRDTYFAIKDIPNEQQEILIENLQSSTNYTVEIRMRNKRGVGPAASVNVTTTEKPEVLHDDETLKLIIASDFQILMQGSKLFYEKPNFIYNSSHKNAITGIGIHVAKNLLFIADTYNIYSALMSNSTLQSGVRIYSKENMNPFPLALSVDWLNNKLYVLFESDTMNQKDWQISRCNFDGDHLQVVYGGLSSKPVHFQVDPFNGYLFWSFSSGSKSDGGLYRLDLNDVSNGVKHEIEPTRIFKKHNIGVFTIDYTKYKILAPIDELNTVISMNLNGGEYKDIRNNTQTPMFHSVKWFALANDLFYWSNGADILTEEYHESSDRYYLSTFKEFAKLSHFIFVCVKLPSAQPTPKPLNPPSNVQALLSVERAKVSWHIPSLFFIQGRGAWQDWTYKLEVIDEENNVTNQTLKEIKAIHYTVSDLKPDTKYRFRVTAYTNAGSGPYSVEYMGQTLKKAENREIVWSSNDGLIQSDILAENVHTLIPQSILNCSISNLEWFEDILYFVCGNSLYSFNRTTNDTKKLDVKDSVQAIAVDWIGRRLYWFNRFGQMITRGNLINFESENLFELTANEVDIKIDSIRGFLYFSTGNSVEYCRLNCNDKDRKKFYSIESFTGRKVMGLTLDFDMERVYWIIRSYNSATLIIAPLIYDEFTTFKTEEFPLSKNEILGPLAYLSNRLMWLQDDLTIVFGNLTGKNLAHIKNSELSDLKTFLVIDKTQRIMPDSNKAWNVIPEAVNASTIQVIGEWNSFKITWQPIETVNHGEVSYEIRYLNQTFVEKGPFLEIKDDKIPAYSQLNVTIKAFTYWASSVTVKKIVHSPSAPPSEPLEPRLFVNHVHNPFKGDLDIEVVFRWNTPKSINGPLIGYKIRCWYEKDNSRFDKNIDYQMQPEVNEKYEEKFGNVKKNVTFYCKVRAKTPAGVGNYSSLIYINTQNEKPIPRVLAASNGEIYTVDFDLKLHKLIVNAGSKVEHLCYIALSEELFWANENNELMAYSIEQRNVRNKLYKLYSMNARVLSLTVDWVERIVYWSQSESESKGSSINSFNLNTKKSNCISQSSHFIINLNVAPLNRQLFWIDSDTDISNRGKLVLLHLDNEKSSVFLGPKNESILVRQQTLFLDTFTAEHEKLVWLNEINQLMSTDIRTGATTTVNFKYQPNMMNLIRDSVRIYWTQNNVTFAENQTEPTLPYQHIFFYPMKILPIFRQNYPPLRCLLPPKDFHQKAELFVDNSTDRALRLNLPVPKIVDNCSFVPMIWKFGIMYAELENEEPQDCLPNTCSFTETSDKVIEIKNLKPYTKYQFRISISNYYTENLKLRVTFTHASVFRTEAGSPSSPKNVVAKIFSPTEIHLTWLPPVEINGPEIQYEVHYSTENEVNGKKNQFKMPVKGKNITSINITELLPNQSYIVWVQAHTTETLYSESKHLKIITLPDPETIKLISKTSKSLTVAWEPYANASRYVMFCRPIEYNDSFAEIILDSAHEINNTNIQRIGDKVTVLKLHPKSRYVFWLQIWFKNRIDGYTWPQKERFVFETHTDRPSAPGKPSIMIRNKEFEVTWAPAESNGAKIEEYSLEGLRMRDPNRAARSTNLIEKLNPTNTLIEKRQTVDESEPSVDSWTVYYKGNDTFWKVNGLTEISMYSFRVVARNANGWGEYSTQSERLIGIPEHSKNNNGYSVILVAATALVVILIVTFSCFFCAFQRKQSKQSDKKNFSGVELATLPHLPRSSTFVQSNNILYTFGPITDGDVALLPQIRSDQITRTDFLGSGAFGEVYEGFLGHIDTEPKTRVAIKTLRKGAIQQEKDEFLQEAKLMSNFKHKHILSLIGVCFDNDTFYIIMELMQGGDLLSFLRKNRPCDGMASALTLLDLTTMCVDIASGCRYLEEMHFVHRDLACRNCLVSSIDPENRVVKIGDFGLARDIYKNDYYRKDGEGLLPVRWMSPESLVDGVFTSQSDIWAFGVLCWEIMTLGQQPYPARNNVEVLHYVRDGGRLDRPINCPDDLYQLMLKCWSYRPEERPTFRYCLDVLQSLRTKFDDIRINLENANRNLAGGIFNRSYLFVDENHNDTKDVVKYENTPINASEMYSVPKGMNSMPKYLEIIYDANDDRPPNPYEIPLTALDGNEIVHTSSPAPSENSSNKSTEFDSIKSDANNEIKVKSRTVSSSSTVSETSVYNGNKKKEPLNEQPEDDDLSETNVILSVALPKQTNNEQLLPPPPPPPIQQQIHDNSKRKLQQMYANANIENAIRNCDGITSM